MIIHDIRPKCYRLRRGKVELDIPPLVQMDFHSCGMVALMVLTKAYTGRSVSVTKARRLLKCRERRGVSEENMLCALARTGVGTEELDCHSLGSIRSQLDQGYLLLLASSPNDRNEHYSIIYGYVGRDKLLIHNHKWNRFAFPYRTMVRHMEDSLDPCIHLTWGL